MPKIKNLQGRIKGGIGIDSIQEMSMSDMRQRKKAYVDNI